jgi:hypothetical protein
LQVVTNPAGKTYLAAIAGVGYVGSDTVHFNSVEVAPLNTNGSVGKWKVCPYDLKGGRSAPATFVQNGRLYVLGGWGDLLQVDVFSDVQWAKIGNNGCPRPWHTSPFNLNMPLYGHTVAVSSLTTPPTAIVMGGNAGQGNYFNNVQFASVQNGGNLGRFFFDTHQFTTPRWGQGTVLYDNHLYIFGGSQRNGSGFLDDVQFTTLSGAASSPDIEDQENTKTPVQMGLEPK